MIRNLVIVLFFSIFLLDSLKKFGLVPGPVTWAPEIISGCAMLVAVFAAAKRRMIDAPPLYVFLGALIIVHILCGIFVNQVGSGVVFAGVRTYLKYVPFFLLPMLFRFTERELLLQFKVITGLTILQLPVALYQRFVLSAGLTTGDIVGGTLVVSSHLSIYLMSFSALILGVFLKGKISRSTFFVLLILALLPTTMNETKGTFIMLPFALFFPVLFNPGDPHRFRRILGFALVGVMFVAIYIPIYDHFMYARYGRSIVDYWTDAGTLQSHLAPQTLDVEGGDETRLGRVDVMLKPAKELSSDPVALFFGLGIGNVGDSVFGEGFEGAYLEQYGSYAYLAISRLQWEIGLFGVLLVMILWVLIAVDARKLAVREDVFGALGLGWIGVLAVLFVSLFYKNIIAVNAISYLFWFYSGVVVSTAFNLRSEFGTAKNIISQRNVNEQCPEPRVF